MLTTGHVDHFRTFGFTVLRGYLADRVSALRAEVDTAIRDAYAVTYDERVIDGISGHYLPMASRLTPVSASLVCDDPRLIDAAEQLLGWFGQSMIVRPSLGRNSLRFHGADSPTRPPGAPRIVRVIVGWISPVSVDAATQPCDHDCVSR